METIIVLAVGITLQFIVSAAILRLVNIYEYRDTIQDAIFQFDDYAWRIQEWRKVSIKSMLFKFWKPLHSFYPNFLIEPKNENNNS